MPLDRIALRLECIAAAGELAIPFTSGILIGIGETRAERLDALCALRELHERHGHLQEIIIQNFRAKAGTRMAQVPDAPLEELLWTVAAARLIFPPEMNLQTPPNLNDGDLPQLIAAGINDWGGVSPVTPDFVNPEKPWPHLETLAAQTAAAGKLLVERLALYPAYTGELARWQTPEMATAVRRALDSDGLARRDPWSPGAGEAPAFATAREGWQCAPPPAGARVRAIIDRARRGERLDEAEIVRLFQARGAEFDAVCASADALRAEQCGEVVTYAVNRNINYTNICLHACSFCAFSKGKTHEDLRGKPYRLDLDEIAARTREAWQRGATEVCMQGGIHPDYTGDTYLDICRAVKAAVPEIHVHAFSPLEVTQGARTLGLPLRTYLARLQEAGLASLPGTAAEILDDVEAQARRLVRHARFGAAAEAGGAVGELIAFPAGAEVAGDGDVGLRQRRNGDKAGHDGGDELLVHCFPFRVVCRRALWPRNVSAIFRQYFSRTANFRGARGRRVVA